MRQTDRTRDRGRQRLYSGTKNRTTGVPIITTVFIIGRDAPKISETREKEMVQDAKRPTAV